MKASMVVGGVILLALGCGCASGGAPTKSGPVAAVDASDDKAAAAPEGMQRTPLQPTAPATGPQQPTAGTEAPRPEPKPVRGKIEQNRYSPEDGSFSVMLPHDANSEEFRSMQVREHSHALGAYVRFGPAARDQSIYWIETYRRINPDSGTVKFEDAAAAIVGNYRTQLENGYRAPVAEQERGEIRLNGLRTLYWHFAQMLPAESRPPGRDTGDRLSHWVYVIDGPKSAALLWVEIPASCNCATGWSQETKTIYKGVDRFVKSFQFTP